MHGTGCREEEIQVYSLYKIGPIVELSVSSTAPLYIEISGLMFKAYKVLHRLF